MTYGDSLSSLSLASELSGGISLYSLAYGSGGHVRVNQLNPRAPIYCVYGACAVCRCVQVRIMAAYSKRGAILMRDSGCSLSCSLRPESQLEKTIRLTDEVIVM